jgi:hypothetical protein
VSTGTHHDLLLLCAAGDNRVVQGLAQQLKSEGLQPKVQTVELLGLAGAITTCLLAVLVDLLLYQVQYWLIPRGVNPYRPLRAG